jgi:aminoglycoside N3'-acetyltransferase
VEIDPVLSLTQADIVAGLRRLGLARGAAVEVHSSLSSLGKVQGGAPTVIQALIEVVGKQGALLMSAYPLTLPLPLTTDEVAMGIRARVRFFGEHEDRPSGMGAVADAFCKWPGACLGAGLHRVCAWGRDANLHCQGYAHLLDIDGWALLIGVDIHRCSSMHLAEDGFTWPAELLAAFHLPEEIQRRYPPDQWYVEYQPPGKPPLADAWGKVQQESERRGIIRRAKIGAADCMLFHARPVVGIYADWLRRDPLGLYGISPHVNEK